MSLQQEKETFETISQKVFELCGKYEAELIYYSFENSLTRYANNVIHQNLATQKGDVDIRLIRGKKTGTVSVSTSASDEMLTRAVESAKEIVENTPENEDLMPILEIQEYKEIDRFCEYTANLEPEKRADIVCKIVDNSKAHDFNAAGIVENGWTALGIANTKGARAFAANSNFVFSATVEGKSGSGWAEGTSWRFSDVDIDAEIAEAVDLAKRSQNPQDIKPGRYTVVLTPAAFGDLLMFLNWIGFNARKHLEGESFLKGKLGKKVFSEKLTMIDDAYDDRWSGLPFDFEAYPRKKVTLVENGVLKNLVYDRWTALKMNADPTGHGLQQPNHWGAIPLNLIVAGGDKPFKEIIKSVKNGLFVVHFHYTNVSELTKLTLTGMTRDGLFMIENGEITRPVKNMRFTQSVEETLNSVVDIASEQKTVTGFFFGGAIVPGIVIDNFNFSSATEFGG